MSLSLWHSIATLVAMAAFFGVCWWAYSPKNRQRFEEDAKLVFKDDTVQQPTTSETESREKP
jgi:cytochrome c oxidase cbb3-type subunit 4